ncbi:gamma-glutamyl-gamma-aminobutyrate hydrolase family protein [Colwelliaceae bacterium BS250]
MSTPRLPIVGIICDYEIIGPHPFHIAGDKYIQAVVNGCKCIPILIPALANKLQVEQLLTTVDGILFTGGYSMVDPINYQTEPAKTGTKLDIQRDKSSFALIKSAVASEIPILGICRGFQEINVAFAGSLHQQLHTVAGLLEHREDKNVELQQQYSAAHSINITANGKLAKILGTTKIDVNSLHTQGVDRLGDGLTIEAQADDGLIEAFSVNNATSFAMAVQWHPEWQCEQNINSTKLFAAFGQACSLRQQVRGNNG